MVAYGAFFKTEMRPTLLVMQTYIVVIWHMKPVKPCQICLKPFEKEPYLTNRLKIKSYSIEYLLPHYGKMHVEAVGPLGTSIHLTFKLYEISVKKLCIKFADTASLTHSWR